jgi:hypothetical protein
MKSPPPLLKYTYVTDTALLSLLWGRGLYVDSQSWDIQYCNHFQLERNYGNNSIEEYTNIDCICTYSVGWFSTDWHIKSPETISA